MTLIKSEVEPSSYRKAVGRFASGVAVITSFNEGGHPVGMTATSFTAVSFDPPSVLICINRDSRTSEHVRKSGKFGINLLGEDAQELSDYCAAPRQDKVLEPAWLSKESKWTTPAINTAATYLDCEVEQVFETGTHTIYLGLVRGIGLSIKRGDLGPLVHYRGSYHQLFRGDLSGNNFSEPLSGETDPSNSNHLRRTSIAQGQLGAVAAAGIASR